MVRAIAPFIGPFDLGEVDSVSLEIDYSVFRVDTFLLE